MCMGTYAGMCEQACPYAGAIASIIVVSVILAGAIVFFAVRELSFGAHTDMSTAVPLQTGLFSHCSNNRADANGLKHYSSFGFSFFFTAVPSYVCV